MALPQPECDPPALANPAGPVPELDDVAKTLDAIAEAERELAHWRRHLGQTLDDDATPSALYNAGRVAGIAMGLVCQAYKATRAMQRGDR